MDIPFKPTKKQYQTILALEDKKTNEILLLLPELRKYFTFRNVCGIEKPENMKRSWLSIIKHVAKISYNIEMKDKMITINKKPIKTRIYIFTKK